MRLKLQRLTTGEKSKIFQTNHGVLVGHLEADYEEFDIINSVGYDNSFSTWDDQKNTVIKNLYPISQLQRKSNVNTSRASESNTYLNVFAPDTAYQTITQYNGVGVGLSNLTDMGIRWEEFLLPPSGVLTNGTFDQATADWTLSAWDAGAGSMSVVHQEASNTLVCQVNGISVGEPWKVQVLHDSISFNGNTDYRVKLRIKTQADADKEVTLRVDRDIDGFVMFERTINLDDKWLAIDNVFEAVEGQATFHIWLGDDFDNVTIDDVSILDISSAGASLPPSGGFDYVDHPPTLAVYPPSSEIVSADYNLYPRYVLSGAYFNFLEEIPVNFDFYDYTTGVMYSHAMNMKNMYDPSWSVSATIVSGVSGTLHDTRYYTDISSDGDDLLYNVYRFQRDYTSPENSYVNEDNPDKMDVVNLRMNNRVDNYNFDQWNPSGTTLCGFAINITSGSYGFIEQDESKNTWIYAPQTSLYPVSAIVENAGSPEVTGIYEYSGETESGFLVYEKDGGYATYHDPIENKWFIFGSGMSEGNMYVNYANTYGPPFLEWITLEKEQPFSHGGISPAPTISYVYLPVYLSQEDVFDEAGLYDIEFRVSDYSTGSITILCGDESEAEEIMTIDTNGIHRAIYDKPTSGPKKLLIRTDGTTDLVMEYVNVHRLSNVAMAYDYIERIEGVYRFQNVPKHKSNMFSIRIRNSNLNDAYTEDDKETIQKSINNLVKKIIDKITPVHTQLFSIDWTED